MEELHDRLGGRRRLVIPAVQTLTAGQTAPVSSIEVRYKYDASLMVFGFERAWDVLTRFRSTPTSPGAIRSGGP